MTPDDGAFIVKTVAYGLFATSGGLMGYVLRTIDAKETIVWSRAILEAFSAGFVGLLVLLACRGGGLSEEWIGVLVGVCGWLGANASIRILEIMVYEKLGIGKFYRGRQDHGLPARRLPPEDDEPYRRPRRKEIDEDMPAPRIRIPVEDQ